jgi:predicted DNA-binding transcriptional regulator AlpA
MESNAATHGENQTKLSRLISIKIVQERCGDKSRQWVYDQGRRDKTFPRPVKTGPYNIAFFEHEIEDWLQSLPRVERDGLSIIERRQAA